MHAYDSPVCAHSIQCSTYSDHPPSPKGHIVVTGFESLPGAAEKGGQIQIGDVVEAIAGRPVLSPAAPRDLPYPQVSSTILIVVLKPNALKLSTRKYARTR